MTEPMMALTLEILPSEALAWSRERRVEAMLARLNAYDFLGAVTFAESILLEDARHGLAMLCRKESMSVMKSFLEGTLAVIRYDTEGLSNDAIELLSGAEGRVPSSLVPESGPERARWFLALHDLVRLEYFETRDNTFVELLVSPAQAAHGSGRIEERANDAAIEELHKVLTLHPGVTFGIARCDEVDFAGIWQLPTYEGAKDVFPLAVGNPPDMARREEHLRAFAAAKFPTRYVEVPGPEIGADPHTVVFVVVAPPRR
ncbi:MAG TPA: hypothetical protein VGH87_23210 [Polyangiaceae bacterium]|jgi:hypothetical protein